MSEAETVATGAPAVDAPATDAPSESVAVAPAAVAPPTPPVRPGTPRLHDVMREAEQTKQELREAQKRIAAAERDRDGALEHKSKLDAYRKDPIGAFKELGGDYQSLSRKIIAGETPVALTSDSVEVQNLKAELAAMREDVGSFKSAAEKRAEAEKQAELQGYQRQWVDHGKQFVEAVPDKFEYLRAAGTYDQMLHEAQAYEQEHGEAPASYEPLAAAVESRLRRSLEDLAPRLAKIPGFVKLITGHASALAENPAESQATDNTRSTASRAQAPATPQRPMLTTKAASAAARSQGEPSERREKTRFGNPHAKREALLAEASGKRR